MRSDSFKTRLAPHDAWDLWVRWRRAGDVREVVMMGFGDRYRYIHDQCPEKLVLDAEGDGLSTIAFNLAVGRGPESGWYCDR